jgi:hydroxymethylbilane synthase
MTRLRLGTRGSRLALTQTELVADALRKHAPGLTVELVPMETFGDTHDAVRLRPELGQSFFTTEIEAALLDGRVDAAVHSCKDLATVLPAGLRLGAIPLRADARDVLVSRGGRLSSLAAGARVGTSSPRRKGFVALARADLRAVDLRGNVPTRVGLVDEGVLDAVVLAAAGLIRLGMSARISEWLEPSRMMPAAAQGALAVQTRDDDETTNALVAHLDHAPSHAEVTAERACLRRIEAGCQAPVGALARASAGTLVLEAAVVGPEGVVRARATAPAEEAEGLGLSVAEDLLGQLGVDSLRGVPWAGPPPERLGV